MNEINYDSEGKNRCRDRISSDMADMDGQHGELLGTGGSRQRAKEKYPWLQLWSIDHGCGPGVSKRKIYMRSLVDAGVRLISIARWTKELQKLNITLASFWLDLCGTRGERTYKSAREIVSVLEDGGKLFLTLRVGHEANMRERPRKEYDATFEQEMQKQVFKKMKCTGTREWEDEYKSNPTRGGVRNRTTVTMRVYCWTVRKN